MSANNLKISTTLTVIVSTGTIVAPNPTVLLLESYEGQAFTYTGQTFFFTVSTGTAFEFEPNSTSTIQTYTYANQGITPITISTVTFSANGVTPFRTFTTSFPITLTTGSTGTFNLYYGAEEQGIYFNEVTFVLDDYEDYTFLTEQQVAPIFVLDYTPTSVVSTLTSVGGYYDTEFIFTNSGQELTSFTSSLTGSSTYTILDSSFDVFSALVSVRFDAIDFPVGTLTTSTATLVITANADTVNIPLSTTVNFSNTANQFISSWSSPLSYDNAYIGISYDIIDSVRTLTIGVGSSGNGSPEIYENGLSYIDMIDLGIRGGNIITPYINWREVYRIPLTTGQTYYLSQDYLVKSKDEADITQNYGYYFGSGVGAGSMFVIEHDGYFNTTIKLNSIREYAGDLSFDRTLLNLQNAFYYFASTDRIYNLESPFDDDKTHYFVGFNNDGSINTSIVVHP